MAVLSAGDRLRVARALGRYWSNEREVVSGFVKADLLAAMSDSERAALEQLIAGAGGIESGEEFGGGR